MVGRLLRVAILVVLQLEEVVPRVTAVRLALALRLAPVRRVEVVRWWAGGCG